MSDSDFNGTPFAAGSLTGLRAFRIDKYGRLLASQLNVVWRPDENVAKCYRSHIMGGGMSAALMSYQHQYMQWSLTAALSGTSAPKPDLPATRNIEADTSHRAGKLDCTCGFYAYFDDQGNRYHTAGDTVQALVQGYGLTTTGERGFRAEKARVQALIIKPKYANNRTDKVQANYPDVPVFDRKRDALDEFPLTRPAAPTPDLDLDFWTRDAIA